MEYALSERKLFTPSFINSISLGLFNYTIQATVITELLETADSEAAHSESIL